MHVILAGVEMFELDSCHPDIHTFIVYLNLNSFGIVFFIFRANHLHMVFE